MANFGNWFGGRFGSSDNDYREAQAAHAISREIANYLGRNRLIDSDGFYVRNKVQGAFPFDLSSFSPMAVKRILSRVRKVTKSVRVSPSYSSSNRVIKFTIKVR
jgi:hypothetical protein